MSNKPDLDWSGLPPQSSISGHLRVTKQTFCTPTQLLNLVETSLNTSLSPTKTGGIPTSNLRCSDMQKFCLRRFLCFSLASVLSLS